MNKKMYAPWRHNYINGTPNDPSIPLKNNCIFCHEFEQNKDDEYFILKRFPQTIVMLNFYPYNAGHIMVLPIEHQGELTELAPSVRTELMEVTTQCLPILKKALDAQGFNIGINLGQAGGGGIPKHLHIHILPRWQGDTNFLETLGGVKVISSDLNKIYTNLKKHFAAIP